MESVMMRMTKLLYLLLLFLIFIAGCEKKPVTPAPAELFVLTGDTTSAGISVGDGPKAFKEAYQDYEVLVSDSDSEIPNEAIPINRITYQDDIVTMIANFFINGKPMTAEQLCKSQDVSMDALTGLLSSSTFLREHEVLYRYLLFYWENGKIRRIESEELNYNETFEVPVGTP